MKLKFTAEEQRALLLAGLLAALGGWLFLAAVGSLWSRLWTVGRDLGKAREELRVLETATSNEAALRAQHEQLMASVAALRQMLPAEEEESSVIKRLQDLARQSQVKIQTIFPQRTAGLRGAMAGGSPVPEEDDKTPGVIKAVPIQIDAQAGYHQLGTFLGLVESDDIPMEVSNLRISADANEPKRHTVRLVVQAYFATNAPVPAPPAP